MKSLTLLIQSIQQLLLDVKSKDGICFILYDKQTKMPKSMICDDERFTEQFNPANFKNINPGAVSPFVAVNGDDDTEGS